MLQVRCRTWAAVAAAAGFCGFGGFAAAAEPTQQELVGQIRALSAKVKQLEESSQRRDAQPGPQARQPAGAGEVAGGAGGASGGAGEATVGSVLRDAELRSNPQLLQAGDFTAGYSKGKFLIQDAKGDFVLNPNFQFQARYLFNNRDSARADGGGDSVSQDGFEIRRMKFIFDGNLFGPDLTYKFQWTTSRTTGGPTLEDAWGRLALGRLWGEGFKDFAIRFGQFKDPWNHEEITSSKRQLAVERSLLNEALGGQLTKYIQGVSFIWDDGAEGLPLRAEIGYSDGPKTSNTNFTNTGGGLPATFPGEQNPQWGAFGRVEYLAMGNWKQYDDFTALGNTETLLAFGAGASYAEVTVSDILFHTVDVQYETGPLGLYAAYVGLYNEPKGAVVQSGGVYDKGFLVQAGYMLNEKWEVFGRYDQVMLDSDRLAAGAEDSFPEITVGVNYYLHGHAAKFTVDGVFAPNGVPTGDFSQTGLLDPDGDESQFVIRTQFQILL